MKTKYALIFIITLGIICYLNALSGDFIWDDFLLVIQNPLLGSFKNIGRIFTSELAPKFDYYRPLQALTYLLDYQIYNLRPWGFHLTNVILHIINALLVFFLLKVITRNIFVSLSGALLFVGAPFYTEAVTFISGRADLLCGLFILSAFLCYIKERYIAALFLFISSLFSREQAMIFPFLLILYDLCFKERVKEKIKYYYLFFLYDILYVTLRITVFDFSQRGLFGRKIYFTPEVSFFPRLLTFLKSIVIYLKIIFFPINLHMERRIRPVENILDPYVLASFVSLLLLLYFILKFKKQQRLILFWLWWFFLLLLPQSSLVSPLVIAEHFLYLPCIGIFVILSLFLENIWQQRRAFISLILGTWILFYSLLTISHNFNWLDPLRFYKWTAKFSPSSHKIHYLLGMKYTERGLSDLALAEFRTAIGIDKNFQLSKVNMAYIGYLYNGNNHFLSIMYHNIGFILSQKGLLKEAEEEYKESLKFDPMLIESYNDLGCLYIKQGELNKAEDILSKGLKIKPNFAKIYYNLGLVYERKENFHKAIRFWKRALDIKPDYNIAQENIERIKHGR